MPSSPRGRSPPTPWKDPVLLTPRTLGASLGTGPGGDGRRRDVPRRPPDGDGRLRRRAAATAARRRRGRTDQPGGGVRGGRPGGRPGGPGPRRVRHVRTGAAATRAAPARTHGEVAHPAPPAAGGRRAPPRSRHDPRRGRGAARV